MNKIYGEKISAPMTRADSGAIKAWTSCFFKPLGWVVWPNDQLRVIRCVAIPAFENSKVAPLTMLL